MLHHGKYRIQWLGLKVENKIQDILPLLHQFWPLKKTSLLKVSQLYGSQVLNCRCIMWKESLVVTHRELSPAVRVPSSLCFSVFQITALTVGCESLNTLILPFPAAVSNSFHWKSSDKSAVHYLLSSKQQTDIEYINVKLVKSVNNLFLSISALTSTLKQHFLHPKWSFSKIVSSMCKCENASLAFQSVRGKPIFCKTMMQAAQWGSGALCHSASRQPLFTFNFLWRHSF